MSVTFSTYNVRLDDGTFTYPAIGYPMDEHPWLISAKRLLNLIFPGDKGRFRIVDLGCLEGGYSVEFARMGFQTLGIDIRSANIACCRYIQERTNLPNLEFVQDDVWNVAKYGSFDAVFCCGLLYHLDRPGAYLKLISGLTRKVLIIQTHFATERPDTHHSLSPELVENEGIPGRWYSEFPSDELFRNREIHRYSSWDNRRSFWIQREYLLQTISEVGFDTVLEQFDSMAPQIADAMLNGMYRLEARGTFVGIKSQA